MKLDGGADTLARGATPLGEFGLADLDAVQQSDIDPRYTPPGTPPWPPVAKRA